MSEITFNKPRRNYRSRKDDSDEDKCPEGHSDNDNTLSNIQGVGARPQAKVSTLSFGDDLNDDDTTFQVKRSTHSRRIAKKAKEEKKSLRSSERDPYDSTAWSSPRRAPKEEFADDFPPANDEAWLEKQAADTKPEKQPTEVSSLLKKGQIPDANVIHLARKQRQLAKYQMEAAEDHAVSPPPSLGTRNDGRRLLREEDNDEEDDEMDEESGSMASGLCTQRRVAFQVGEFPEPGARRIEISKGLHRREEEMRCIREDFLAAEHASDRDSDQETEWERQQIQKAISSQNTAVLEALQPSGTLKEQQVSDATHGSRINSADISLASLKCRLQTRLEGLQKSVAENKGLLEATRADLARGQAVIHESRQKMPQLIGLLSFYLEMSEYVMDVVDCFNEKMPKIEYMERRILILLREKTDHVTSRRRTDLKDIADEIALETSSSEVVEDAKLSESRKRRKADREARRLRRQRMREAAVVVARTTRGSEPMPAAGRRSSKESLDQEAVSTDDEELTTLLSKRNADISDIINDAAHLFDDVVEEFCELPAILQHFVQWRTKAPDSYAKAYIALCLPQIFSPLIRLQLLRWNPLTSTGPPFEGLAWFGCLLDYSAGSSASEAEQAELNSMLSPDSDSSILPNTIEKVLLSRLTEIVAAAFDPLSSTQSLLLVKLVRSLAVTWPSVHAESNSSRRLFEAILKRIEDTIQEDIFIPLYPRFMMEDQQSAAFQFFNRQMNVAYKLLSNILLWEDLLSPEALKHLTLTSLVNRYILVGLASLVSVCPVPSTNRQAPFTVHLSEAHSLASLVERTRSLLNRLPDDWFPQTRREPITEAEHDPQTAQIKRFIDQLLSRYTSEPRTFDADCPADQSVRSSLKALKKLQKHLLGKKT